MVKALAYFLSPWLPNGTQAIDDFRSPSASKKQRRKLLMFLDKPGDMTF